MEPGRESREDPVNPRAPLVVAIDMGYGHLRAAWSVAHAAGTSVVECDRPPIAGAEEQASWRRARAFYESLSRGAGLPFVGPALRRVLDGVTGIRKMRTAADLRPSTAATRALLRMTDQGLGRGLVAHLRATGRPLVATFYSPAIVADAAGIDGVVLVVTDTDVHRVWAPGEAGASRITYCVPAERAAERLRRYGVPHDRIVLTGFPLPQALLGGAGHDVALAHLSRRIARLDPTGAFRRGAEAELIERGLDVAVPGGAPLVALAVGGAGAQLGDALAVLDALLPAVRAGRLRLALVAGTRAGVADVFRAALARARLDPSAEGAAQILLEPDVPSYLAAFERLLPEVDVLWTKPSELTFYAALGIPLLLARPLGVHEKSNRRWVLERGAAFDARSGRAAAAVLEGGLADGTLASAAWNGFRRLPRDGTARVLEVAARVASRRGADDATGPARGGTS